MELTASTASLNQKHSRVVNPGDFTPSKHFYPRVLNAQIHPLVAFFLRLGNRRTIERYCHLHPRVDPGYLATILTEPSRYLRWAGTDLFCTTTSAGNRRLVVLETNSCPSGNKSMPMLSDDNEHAGYKTVLEESFLPSLKKRGTIDGGLAVIYDKNFTEASGYAATMADLTEEEVHLVPFLDGAEDAPVKFSAGVLYVLTQQGKWIPIRAAFRYLTQRPWMRMPVHTKTRILNPIVACLAGGRNKLTAAKAYDLYNGGLAGTGLSVNTPETISDVAKGEVPLLVQRFGGQAVVKIPYSNAGQGVFPILCQDELNRFMEAEHPYDTYVVQSLIGNYSWSSTQTQGRYYHVGTMPDRRGDIYVADVRMMVCAGPSGFKPVAVYARKAAVPLPQHVQDGADSWSFLGTNLSNKTEEGWAADTERLLIMDRRDFNTIGIGMDDLIEAYVQTVLSVKAIDQLASTLLTKKGDFRHKLFGSLNKDVTLLEEIRKGCNDGVAVTRNNPK